MDNAGLSASDVGLSAERLAMIPAFFQRGYLDTGRLPCMATLVSRNGQIVHQDYRGTMAFDSDQTIGPDTIFRIFSMTKPITSLAIMILFERGLIRLDHEVSRYIPAFKHTGVWNGGDLKNYHTRPVEREITIRDLLTHTSGLSYGFLFQHEVDALYRREQLGEVHETLEDMCNRLATMPLLFSPGTAWNYGHSTDVLGRIVEIISGQPIDQFFEDNIFAPLGMRDTGFYVPEDQIHRLAACYRRDPLTKEVSLVSEMGAAASHYNQRPLHLSPGGGLVSTLRDYHKFCLMFLQGGLLNGARILSPKTIEFMRLNHLPDGQTIKQLGDRTFSEVRMDGNGFGLGGSVIVDVAKSMLPGSAGMFSWGGMANTFFWIDPEEELIAIQATQMMPSGNYPIRPQFQQLVYAAIEW